MNIGIIGLGFMGGSLARSLSKLDTVKNIIAFDKNIDSLKMALNDRNITKYTDSIDDNFKDCNIIFISVPISYIEEIVLKLKDIVSNDCIITDMGSTKGNLIKSISKYDVNFIGAHPMIGSEKCGYSTSRDDLFEQAYYIICKSKNNKDSDIEILSNLIKSINGIPILVDSLEHDYFTACISHVPQVVATTLVNTVKDLDNKDEILKTLAAGGFKDTTRIASSEPDIWVDIIHENKDEVLKVLDKFSNNIDYFKSIISDDDALYDYFLKGKNYRDSFINNKINNIFQFSVEIKDENHSLATVINLLSDNGISISNMEIINNREDDYGVLKISVKNNEMLNKSISILENNDYKVFVLR